MALVPLDQAAAHLRIAFDVATPDPDLTLKAAQAEAIILAYCATTTYWRDLVSTWNTTTAPPAVIAAILLELGELWRFRGDDPEAPPRWEGTDLHPAIIGLLRRARDPVVQ